MGEFSGKVIRWQKQSGRHGLPWQQTRDPYRRWIAEIMLQQTQVSAAIPYYERFMKRFPSVQSLAAAPEDDVMRLWAGLGYYARARNLIACARLIAARGGEFPKSASELSGLPGIGRSTAAAIAAGCWEEPAAILDGNAKRVFSRFFGVKRGESESAFTKRLWEIAEREKALNSCSVYAQGLMDLGATVCVRSKPRCGECPLSGECKAEASGAPGEYPGKKIRPPKPVRDAAFLILKREGSWWLVKRPGKGIWAGLFCLPSVRGKLSESDAEARFPELRETGAGHPVLFGRMEHEFTHFTLRMTIWKAVAGPGPDQPPGTGKWVPVGDVGEEAVPSPVSRLASLPVPR